MNFSLRGMFFVWGKNFEWLKAFGGSDLLGFYLSDIKVA
jgi:hypothetical protein